MRNAEEKGRPEQLIADSMLGSTARKLRMFGFDVLYFNSIDDAALLRLGMQRTLITCDEELYERAIKKGEPAIIVKGIGEASRLKTIFDGLRVIPSLSHSRCTSCNGELEMVPKSVLNSIPPKVLEIHRRFYRCRHCGKVYWAGSHWIKMRRLAYRIKLSQLKRTMPAPK